MKVVVTGATGLLGWHTSVRLHARNRAARFRGESEPFELVVLNRPAFLDPDQLQTALAGADAVLHFAGVNRAPEGELERANPDIAEALVQGCRNAGVAPHIVYANSTHSVSDSVYGRSKRHASEILGRFAPRYTDLVLPHIFGERARPHYNNVTATFVDQVIHCETPTVNPEGTVQLLHAGAAAETAIETMLKGQYGTVQPDATPMAIPRLLDLIQSFHESYQANLFPDFRDTFELALFNTYRAALYPGGFPRPLETHADSRGVLFEAAKGGGGGQTFLSWTEPGKVRGDHFHLAKVERFLVLDGEGVVRIRRVLGEPVWEYRVNGKEPAVVDMPTLHTHSIENVGDRPMLTLFWANDVFDRASPDTYWDPVRGG